MPTGKNSQKSALLLLYIVDLAASQLLRIYTCDMFLDKSVAKVLEAWAKMLIVIKREILDLDAAL